MQDYTRSTQPLMSDYHTHPTQVSMCANAKCKMQNGTSVFQALMTSSTVTVSYFVIIIKQSFMTNKRCSN